ncbi:MAG: DNA mismatch repair protein [Mycobacteriaceae bacterium]|nr:DNA mismatch repair protein [Mycobacteriaceae bacterium]
MNVNLLLPDHGYIAVPRLPVNGDVLVEDLELRTLYAAMAGGDEFIGQVVAQIVPAGIVDPRGIAYRQQVLEDCLQNEELVRRMYRIVADAVDNRPKGAYAGFMHRAPEGVLHRSVEQLDMLLAQLQELRGLRHAPGATFESEGFRALFGTLADQLDADYVAQLEACLAELRLPRGVMFSAGLGAGNKSAEVVLHRAPARRGRRDLFSGRSFRSDDDEGSARAITGQAIHAVADTAAQAAGRLLEFALRLRTELAFYVGCLTLWRRLTEAHVPLCFPTPLPVEDQFLRCRDLRDVGLCLTAAEPVVGNELEAAWKSLIMVTGANAGGKSTFLRSVGVAQVMMQAGMFVAAESFMTNVRDGVFTHFTREEDAGLEHGKLDEELIRMRRIVDDIGPNSLLLCNESFSAVNDREGSEIARQVVGAMTDCGVKVVFVTHHYDLAARRYLEGRAADVFLRAEPAADGRRTFRLQAAEPAPTSHAEDSFQRIFHESDWRTTMPR